MPKFNFADLEEDKQSSRSSSAPPKPPKNLKPPKPPKLVEDTILPELDEITFQEIANSTEFKRLVYLIWFGKTHRGKTADLEKQLVKRKQEITVVEEVKRGSKKDFAEVVKELKEVLSERKKVVELA